MKKDKSGRSLADLVSVGPATLKDLSLLDITSCTLLAKQEPHDLYKKLCLLTKQKQDPCVEDVFAAAIAQARDPELPNEQKHWSYWSQIRKSRPCRCAWVPIGNTLQEHYHDTEWGVPVHDDRKHFEFLILEGAQAGLSWEIILKRREEYAKAFAGFDWREVAKYKEDKVDDLMKNSGIIRNRSKIQGAITNAILFSEIVEEFGSFTAYIWQFVQGNVLQPKRKSIVDLPCQIPESQRLSKDMKARGFKFVGPTVMYSHMQATGLVNDHTVDCFRYKELIK